MNGNDFPVFPDRGEIFRVKLAVGIEKNLEIRKSGRLEPVKRFLKILRIQTNTRVQ